MSAIEQCYASGGDMIIKTLEVRAEGESSSLLYCQGFDDVTCTTEDGRTLTFLALPMDEALPKNDSSGYQSLNVALDNTMGEVQKVVEGYRAAGKRIHMTHREYLYSDLSYPANKYRMTVLSREYADNTATFACGFFDLLNTAFPRRKLTTLVAPGLKYI
ncbi:DUF1833 family protein [Pseudomonas fluorescens]|uniref:DUF1833 domain-containing protein n=1 Tax=Pseudomonas fluorescens TaxID=294 RepID=A0A5E7ECU4_PSEFL|nr:DUF1833 family protein [Pseudomonas fluorescens]VVO23983.1 hypothetical protein PS710_04471 [Pseudomonas fluorescens]